MHTLWRSQLLLCLFGDGRESVVLNARVLLSSSLIKELLFVVGQHWPVFNVADDVGPAVGWDVAQIAVEFHLHFRLLALLLFACSSEVRMQSLEVERRGEDITLDALAVLRYRF